MPAKKSPANVALGAAIRSMREERGYSQESFGAHARIDPSYYGAIERGEFNPTVDTIVKIVDGLEVGVHELVRRAEALH